MIGDYEEDDAHFCLKCHTTIIGLDNYVNHRKTGCSKSVVDLPKSPLPSQLLPPDESFSLKADDFFSSLELQSSSKKLPPPSSSGKNFGILTRSKTTAVIQAKDHQQQQQQQQQELPQSKSGKNVWIGGHQLKLGYGDNQSKLIKAVDNLERRKDEPPKIDVYEDSDVESQDYDYDVEESSDDDNAPPRNHTGGKWKPSSPIDWNVPSPSYTGGKWKPIKRSSPPPPLHTKGKWKPSSPPPSPKNYEDQQAPLTGGKWSQSKTPPSNHTKGKWKPDENWNQTKTPPSNHTKGKWKPEDDETSSRNLKRNTKIENKTKSLKITDDSPFRKSSGTVQYWCRPCNRRLASKVVYERHLKSELHFKRTLNDKELDDNLGLITEKRNKKKLTVIIETRNEKSIKKRKRKKIFIKCEVCRAKVNRSLIGKHLISHYHCRKGDGTTQIARNMILDNIWAIILQSPFQCGLCKFYFNHHKDFLHHWQSEYHQNKDRARNGYFWCSFCKYKTYDNHEMYNHLLAQEHNEVISVINRSVPIVIKKLNPIQCQECDEEFLYNFALIKHCRLEKHKSGNLKDFLNNYICLKCDQVFRSNISLKRHKQTVHEEIFYICTVCNRNFKTNQEAKSHRNTADHKYNVLKKNHKVEVKQCEYCEEKFTDFIKFKQHLRDEHREFCPKCIHCGANFAVSQELTVHLRTKSCKSTNSYNLENSCDKCPYSSNSTSELLYHQVLHNEPLLLYPDDAKKKPVQMYKCPLCEKLYPKYSLQGHLRLHTKERPYVCSICKKSFVRKNSWLFHYKNHQKKDVKELKKNDEKKICGNRPFLCSTCGASFQKRSILQQHMTTHTGKMCKCPKIGCVFSARTMGELKMHFQTHSDVRNFACNLCEYRGKTKTQLNRHMTVHDNDKKYKCNKCEFSSRTAAHLKRHIRLHTGSKPYNCPHCNYKCNTMENLRKHILLTGKHRGKSIYECKFCDGDQFQTNFAKDLKAHLITEHPQMFNASKATSYIAGIYDVEEDRNIVTEISVDEQVRAKPHIIVVQKQQTESNQLTQQDPVVGPSKDTNEDCNLDEIFPMYIVAKDEVISVDTEAWNLVGSYDVEESGALVPFNSDSEVLFQEI